MGPEATVRLATSEDAEAISDILRVAFSELKDGYTPEAFEVVTPSAEVIATRFAQGPQWVAIIDGRPVGTVSVFPEPGHLYIRSMAVLPETQGAGVGKNLLDAVEVYAIEAGFERLFLHTTYFSKSAIRLYEKCGFKWVGDTTAEEWYGTPGLGMEKKLTKSQHA
jgi:ribosomal protein S18 acetylase RimI-like enzyme